jgi:hypothetical protein
MLDNNVDKEKAKANEQHPYNTNAHINVLVTIHSS